MRRLVAVAGEWIDRDRPLRFRFEGREYNGFAGDTITSALLANGVHLLGRSFKYHRPRGVLSFANHDVNVMVQAGSEPNVRADVTPLEEGLDLRAVNTRGGLERDRGRFIEWLAPFLPVGFYYKAFHSKTLFPFWERMIRGMAGLGTVDLTARRVRTAKRYDWCDVLVIGGGPSGLAAALAAADAGAEVVLVDENARLGGSGQYNLGADQDQRRHVAQLAAAVHAHERIRVYLGTYAAGYYADHWVPLVGPEFITKVRAGAVVCATGAFEQPAVFGHNDLPGVMLGSAAQRLIYRYAVAPGTRAVVLAGNTDAYRVALDLHTHGVTVAAIADLREEGETSPFGTEVRELGIPVFDGFGVYEAVGRERVTAARIAPVVDIGRLDATCARRIECDLIVMSVGWAPAASLLNQAGMRARFDEHLSQFVPEELPEGVYACGRVNGIHHYALKLEDGRRAGLLAAEGAGVPVDPGLLARARALTLCEASRPSHSYPIFEHARGWNFVDFDEDLRLDDFRNAVQEGFDSIELLKRYTTVGMGPSQGKHSNMNAIRILARLRHTSPGRIGAPTSRPMFHPVPMSHLAGRGFHVERETPLHAEHEALGARFMLAGQWRRPEYYARGSLSREEAIREEVLTVRRAVGVIDVGTLGKIEVRGPDAAEFIERVYTGRFVQQKAGTTRYGLMLDEAGVIVDDGVVARLAPDHFYITTTTSGSASVYRELQRLAIVWRMRVMLANLTGHMGAVNLAGPRARAVLSALTSADLSERAFPYLAVRVASVAGVECRLMRVGFVGELGYEVHAPADCMAHVWNAILEAGRAHGMQPFGVEAQRVLRLEKGHLIVGQDTDGLTNPYEAGCEWALAMDKPFFVGKRSLEAIGRRPLRQRLAGFELIDSSGPLPKECHLVVEKGEIAGRVTSIALSPTLGRAIGLAMLTPSLAEPQTRITIRGDGGEMIPAVVVPTPFYDARNERQRLPEAA